MFGALKVMYIIELVATFRHETYAFGKKQENPWKPQTARKNNVNVL